MKRIDWLLIGIFVSGAVPLWAQDAPPAGKELNDTLQDARAIPYIDPATGKMDGYVVDSGNPKGNFQELKLKQGDSLTGMNEAPEQELKDSETGNRDERAPY